jgi:hypothetical protein
VRDGSRFNCLMMRASGGGMHQGIARFLDLRQRWVVSLAPLLRGEGRGEGLLRQTR